MSVEKRWRKKFKVLAENIRRLYGSERIDYVMNNVLIMPDINYTCDHDSFLLAAVENSDDVTNVEIIRMLMEKGADINVKNRYGHTLLYSAISYSFENVQTISLLLDYIKDPSALFSMANMRTEGYEKILELYLEKRFDINYVESYETLLTKAIGDNNKKIVKILLEMGSEIGFNALLNALTNMEDIEDEILHMLLEAGADAKSMSIEKIYKRFNFCDRVQICRKLRILLEYGMDISNKEVFNEKFMIHLLKNHKRDDIDIFHMFLRRDDFNVNYYDEHNELSLIEWALNYYRYDVVKLLLDYGTDYTYDDPNRKSFLACLSLHNAEHRKIYEIIQEIEFSKRYKKKIIEPSIKTIFGEFTLNPYSIHSKTMAIKWDLERMNKDEVYAKYKDDLLMAYYGISDGYILQTKILDQLKN